ncbi:MAG: DpnD/PcfM family protein [Oscillospiraceae bacterium]
MNEYDITIRKTLEMTVTVEAESREEARQIVADRWKNSEYILDADSFKDVEFYPRGRSRDRGER